MSRVGLIIAVAIGCAAMVLSVCGIACSGIVNNNNSEYHLTGGVAATVNGENLTEDTITKQIMSTRTSGGYKKDKSGHSTLSTKVSRPSLCASRSSTATRSRC